MSPPHALDKSNKEPQNKAATNGVPAISVFLKVGWFHFCQTVHIIHNGIKFQKFDKCLPDQSSNQTIGH